jgi:hypothetical protein
MGLAVSNRLVQVRGLASRCLRSIVHASSRVYALLGAVYQRRVLVAVACAQSRRIARTGLSCQ